MDASAAPPCFVLTPARAGSTLLRLILDAHPEMASPPELNLCAAFGAIQFAAFSARSDDPDAARAAAAALSREVADRTIGAYAARAGKKRWCEKSLPSGEQAELLLEVFPEAQFICLFRECTDTVASLAEASAWGYGAYGVEPYVRLYPMNVALALGLYWADKVQAIRTFEDAHPERCFRIRYEDLVSSPEATLKPLFSFLALSWDESYLEPSRIFGKRGPAGAGDLKIRYTESIETTSVGRGWTVPVEVVPPDIRARIDRLSAELGYPPLEADVRESLTAPARPGDDRALSVADLFGQIASRLATDATRPAAAATATANRTLKVVLADDPDPYLLDFGAGRIERSDQRAACTVLTDSETLLAIGNGSCNPATALRQSTLRLASDDARSQELLLPHLDELVSVLPR